MMNSVQRMIWILVLTLLTNVRCQDEFNDQNMLRVQQVANEGQIEANTGFNNLHNDPNSQNLLNTRYQMPENSANFEFNRETSKPRKVYRIKNPFQNQEEAQDNGNAQDGDTSASNQYAGMQYSLPPEEFLQQMRAENQYQQQQQQQQLSTPSVYSYTATPQPQYLYSTMTAASYANQPNQNVQETKSLNYYNPNVNSFQFNNANTYGFDAPVSTPAPSYLSTSSNQYMGTPANTYISSPSPMYITNPPNLQPSYVSSPYSNTQTGTVDYNANKVATIGHNALSYDNNNIYNKKVQVDHYSNSGNTIRYPDNVQYQNYQSSTSSPVSSPYSEEARDNWGNAATNYNNGVLHKSTQDMLVAQYSTNPHYRLSNNQNDYKHNSNYDNVNQDNQRFNTLSANNNMYYSYSQPQNQANNLKSHAREVDQQIGQTSTYSHGDYGWKLDRKPQFGSDISTAGYSGYQNNNAKSDNEAISQVSFHMDTNKPYNYNQISKSSSEKLEAEEFVRAATKAHDNYKQQLELSRISNGQYNNNAYTNADLINSYYANNDRNKNKPDNSNDNAFINGNTQPDYVTASPYYVRENYLENKPKQVFDHDKAIKNIVPIDVSNVVQNSNAQLKSSIGIDSYDKYSNKDQYNRPISETYYKDKNNVYTFSIKSQPEDYHSLSDRLKQLELSTQQGKSSDTFLGYNSNNNKRYVDDSLQTNGYGNQNPSNSDNLQSSGNIQQSSLQRSQIPSDLAALLKFNDIPLRLTQHLNSDSLRLPGNKFDIGNLPNPLPVRLNQNVEQHHVDVASDIISKILAARQNTNKQELDVQNNNQLSTIHGFKVANPFNIDLKLVSDMLKAKPVIDDSQPSSVRDQYGKPMPIKFDLQQLQQLLLKNDNGNLNSLGIIPSSYFDMYSNGRYPYQGIKYSRSEEEPENIPIAESSNSHLIGAVVEEMGQDTADITETDDDVESSNDDDRTIKLFNTQHRTMGERFRHTNNLGRHMYQRKFPKTTIDQPHPVLKPPHKSRSKLHPTDKINRKRRINKPKQLRFFKTEPLFEANTLLENKQPAVSTLLKPPPVMEDKSDVVDEEQSAIDNTK